MRGLFTNDSIRLCAGEVASGISARARTLRVHGGNAWITIEGDSHDFWLSAGESLVVKAGRLVVVEAQPDGLHAAALVESSVIAINADHTATRLIRALRAGAQAFMRSLSTRPPTLAQAADCRQSVKCQA